MGRRHDTLLASEDLTVLDVRCSCSSQHVDDEETAVFEVVFPTAGMYRRTSMRTTDVDATTVYAGAPGTGQRIEHVTQGDRCVAVVLSPQLADELGVHDRPLRRTRAHDRVVAAARRGVGEEAWVRVLHGLGDSDAVSGSPSAAHQRAVARVREAIAGDPGAAWPLRALAGVAGYAPHHLSRIFHATTGMTVSEHRERVRLAAAAQLVADGMPIADVAAMLGFADHAHLTRRIGRAFGVPPSQLRA